MKKLISILLAAFLLIASPEGFSNEAQTAQNKQLVYLTSDIRIPFWEIMSRGVINQAKKLGYQVKVYSADNQAKKELKNTIQAIKDRAAGIIVSPTNSSACVTILDFAKQAQIPVVIADIGTESGDYVSYIASDNQQGAYDIGRVLAQKMQQRHWLHGTVGIIGIPQSRANGKARTTGFLEALDEYGIKGAGIKQQADFSYQETYDYTLSLIQHNSQLKAIWLQGSDRYQGALDAIKAAGKTGEILLLTFDAEPEFLQLIQQGTILAAAMQQPFLMGELAVQSIDKHLSGIKVPKEIKLSVLPVSSENIQKILPTIQRNVLGLEP